MLAVVGRVRMPGKSSQPAMGQPHARGCLVILHVLHVTVSVACYNVAVCIVFRGGDGKQ